MAEIHLVCEGDPGALDERVLQFALGARLGVDVEFFATGGDASVKNACSFLERSLRRRTRAGSTGGAQVFSVQDRNYQASVPERTVIAAPAARRSFVWARHEIENYLFEPSLLLHMFTSWRTTNLGAKDCLPRDLGEVEALLVDLKAMLRVRHAGELTREALRRAAGWPTDASPGKSLPPLDTADEEALWGVLLADLKQQEQQWVTTMQASIEDARPTRIFAHWLEVIDDPAFVSKRRHLTDLGGHELVTALWTWLYKHQIRKLPHKQLSIETLEDQLYAAFEGAYEPDRTFQPDEFVLLADRLRHK